MCQPVTTHQTVSDFACKKVLGKPAGWNPDSCPPPPATIAEANDQDVGATGCAAINGDKFNFQLCNTEKAHAKKLTFPQKQLVIAKYPVHLIAEEILFVV